jgi:hypothetical protein
VYNPELFILERASNKEATPPLNTDLLPHAYPIILVLEVTRLSRVINLESAGKDRTRLSKGVVLAIRELARQSEPGPEARDLAAFIAMALVIINETIDASVAAWEKRGYWVKADRFRMEWAWAGQAAEKMQSALLSEDWGGVAQASAFIAQKLGKITVPPGHRLGAPWVGAWNEFKKQKKSTGSFQEP